MERYFLLHIFHIVRLDKEAVHSNIRSYHFYALGFLNKHWLDSRMRLLVDGVLWLGNAFDSFHTFPISQLSPNIYTMLSVVLYGEEAMKSEMPVLCQDVLA